MQLFSKGQFFGYWNSEEFGVRWGEKDVGNDCERNAIADD